MISFDCPRCGAGLKVPDEKGGKRGRCPKCKTIIKVPAAQAGDLLASPGTGSCDNSRLQKLYDYIVRDKKTPIQRHVVSEDGKITFEMATGQDGSRRQRVSAFVYDDADLGQCLCVVSQIGSVADEASAEILLKAANFMVGVRVCLTPDGIGLVLIERKLSTCDEDEFSWLVLHTAQYADRLESTLWGWDMV